MKYHIIHQLEFPVMIRMSYDGPSTGNTTEQHFVFRTLMKGDQQEEIHIMEI